MESWDHIIAWTVSSSIFILLRPIWIRRRLYFIALGALFFTPTVVIYSNIMSYFTVWPLILAIPNYLSDIKAGAPAFIGIVVPTGAVVALIFWGIAVSRKI